MEVILASSPVDAGISCFDLRTGAEQLRYRSCSSAPHGLVPVSSRVLASSQLSSTILYWSWDKPHPEVRSFPAEPIGPLISDSQGTFLLGGAKSGNIYLWEVSSGRLLKKWQAHYRSVTCLAFPDDESLLISGSEDGCVRVWALPMLFDDRAATSDTKRAMLHSFTDHALCVTDVVCGYGMCNSIVISSSEDRTCKVWSLSKGKQLRSVSFPSVINAVAMDPGEHAFYAGGRDGKIYIAALNAQCSSSSTHGMYIIGSLSEHSKCITCLAFSVDGVTLVSGSEDGTIRVWDTASQHLVRVLKHANGPINNVLIVRHPLSSNGKGDHNLQTPSIRKRARLPLPPPLEKYSDLRDGIVDSKPVTAVLSSSDEDLYPKYCSYLVMKTQLEEIRQQGSSGAAEMESGRLKMELKHATTMAHEYKKLYHDLHKVFVDEILDARVQADDS